MLRAAATPRGAAQWLRDRAAYQQLPGAERLRWRDSFPKLTDRLPSSPFDPHYFHQDVWAARRIAERRPSRHVDVGSRVDLVGFLTAVTEVTFVDIRPLEVDIEGLEPIAGSVLDLPFADGALESVSCLHVAEHIGLGRYGDPLDPLGTRKAAAELQRVLAPGRPAAVLAPGRPAARGLQRAPRARPGRGRGAGSTGSSWPSSRAWTTRACSGATAPRRSSRARPTPAACIS